SPTPESSPASTPTASSKPSASPSPASESEPVPNPASGPAPVLSASPSSSPADVRPAAPSRASAPAAAVEHDVPPWEDLPAEAYADDDGRPTRSERMPAPEPEASSHPASESWARAPLVAPVPVESPAASAPTGPGGDASVLLALGDWRGLIRALG